MQDRGPSEPKDGFLTDRERRLARVLALEPEIPRWRAGWLAGYCGGDPGVPEPEDTKTRDKLAKSATKASQRPRVVAEIERLRKLAASEVMSLARVGDPEARVEFEARQRRLDEYVADLDTVKVGAQLLDLKLRAAQADIGEYVTWDADTATVVPSDELTKEQRQLVRKLTFHPTCGKCGAEHATPGVTLELEPRATFAAQATKQLGLDAAKRLEVAGKDGGPIHVQGELGLTWTTIEAVRHAIIGRPVE